MTESTVYLIQEPTSDKNLTSAKTYGKIVPIISSEAKPARSIAKIVEKIVNALESYDPAKDYLCWAGGDPLVCFLAGVVASQIGLEEVNYLLWNRGRDLEGKRSSKEGFYVPKMISLLEGAYQ